MPAGLDLPKVPTHWMMLEKLQELFPLMVGTPTAVTTTITDLNTRAEQIKTSHINALKEADERSRNLERTKAESDRSLKACDTAIRTEYVLPVTSPVSLLTQTSFHHTFCTKQNIQCTLSSLL